MTDLPYLVLRRIGQGAMAEVLLAQLRATGARVAIKRVLPPLRRRPKVLALFREEARLLARLSHPNIPALLAADPDASVPWLALEYVDGADLGAVTQVLGRKRKRWDLGAVEVIARDVAQALAYAHALRDDAGQPLRVVHRDVTPSNVLLSVSGEVRLIDFGVARHDGRPNMTRTGALVGKLAYMAPEQLRGGKVDARTDVFGWGVLVYQLLAGTLPFGRDHAKPEELSTLALTPLARHRRNVPAPLATAVERALAEAPERRFPDGAALLASLGAAGPRVDFTALVREVAASSAGDEREPDDQPTLVDRTLTARSDGSSPTTDRNPRGR